MKRLTFTFIPLALLTLAISIIGLIKTPYVSAQSAGNCNVTIVIDRSASVSLFLPTLIKQVENIFAPAPEGLGRSDINIAFWSFASAGYDSSNGGNYDAPYNDFVSSQGGSSSFNNNLNSITFGGGSNYIQGFGYNGGVSNPDSNMARIIANTGGIVFLSDGEANTPGSGYPTNPVAIAAGRTAAQNRISQGIKIVGGLVGSAMNSTDASNFYYILTGSRSIPAGQKIMFPVSADYTDLTQQLKLLIPQACNPKTPPPTSIFSLSPTVTSSNRVTSGAGTATFNYDVNNSSSANPSGQVNWSVQSVVVNRGQSVEPLYFGNSPYRDNYSCSQLLGLIGNNATPKACTTVASGQRTFGPGDTSLNGDAGTATTLTVNDSWPIGTKVCYVLTLDRPTQNATPVNRYSHATCLTIGKQPTVHIYGGDLRVGRHFATDPIDDGTGSGSPALPASVMTSITPKSDGKTYGSWVEYGIMAPGVISGIASLSGLEGGSTSAQANWSKLTFANTDNTYGFFTPYDSGQGTILDDASTLLAGHSVVQDLSTVSTVAFNGATVKSGIYQKLSGNLSIGASVIPPSTTVIVNVPNGVVTVTGNISYDNGPYTDISQIPQLIIIAKTINIDESVTNVDAWLIADSTSDGTISTCDNPATLTILICNQELTINGPVMARHLNLRRTGGSGLGGTADDPAEVINLPGTSYLWAQSEGHSDLKAQTTFTTELPPYF